MDKFISKEIEEQYSNGKPYTCNGVTYRIRSMCKYYKYCDNGVWKQYDIALYLTKEEDRTFLKIVAFNLD